jgi:hypothetical protein
MGYWDEKQKYEGRIKDNKIALFIFVIIIFLLIVGVAPFFWIIGILMLIILLTKKR